MLKTFLSNAAIYLIGLLSSDCLDGRYEQNMIVRLIVFVYFFSLYNSSFVPIYEAEFVIRMITEDDVFRIELKNSVTIIACFFSFEITCSLEKGLEQNT